MNECAIIEITLNNKKGFIILVYRSPSQTADEFEEFMLYLDETLHNISSLNSTFKLMLCDFNAKSSSWYDKDATSPEGLQIESLTSFYGFS